MKQTKNTAFTLVELIVVITILAVLATVAFISFQGYTSSSRDAVRLSDLKNVEKQLNIHFTQKNKYPDPGNAVAIPSGGSQGVLDKSVTNQIGVSEVQDPLTKESYFYRISENKRKYQLLGFLENSDSITFSPFSNTFANNDIPFSKGDKLGIVLNTDGKTLPASIDLSTGTYDVIFSSDTQDNLSNVSGEDNFVVLKSSDKGFYDESLVGYWDMETFTSDGKLADLSGNNNHGTINDANNSGLATPVNGAMVFDGVDDYVEIADSGSLDIQNEITIIAKFNSNTTNPITILNKRNISPGSSAGNYAITIQDGEDLRFRYQPVSVTDKNTSIIYDFVGKNTFLGFSYTYGDVDSVKLNLDGKIQTMPWVATREGNELPILNTYSLVIGGGIDAANVLGRLLDGTIDEIMIFNRALSQVEINEIYTQIQ